jgi:hypothetical protein
MMSTLNLSSAIVPVFLVVAVCAIAGLTNAALAVPGSHALTTAAEGLMVGGSTCSDFMDGVAVGMGIGVLFGCVWCGAGAVVAKGIALFC